MGGHRTRHGVPGCVIARLQRLGDVSALHSFKSLVLNCYNRFCYIIMLRVFVNRCKEPDLIITAYKTTKIDKYED